MDTCSTWNCPGCGALVALPACYPLPSDVAGERTLNQLAQASCGCWVPALSARGMARLLEAIICIEDGFGETRWVFAGKAE